MKMVNWAIVGVLILLPFFVINRLDTETQRRMMITELRYDAVLDTAVDDAAQALLTNMNQQKEAQYDSGKRVRVNKEEAIATFYRTLYLNFGIWDDPISQGVLNRYIPAVAVIGYDGFYVYAEEEFSNTAGETKIRPVWSPMKPYAYADTQGNSLSFTLDDYVTAYEAGSGEWQEGFRTEIQQTTVIPLLHDPQLFEQVRRNTIVNAIQNELTYRINRHNEYAMRTGVSYTFMLPAISQEEWNNTINDTGVLAFIQGIPMGSKVYNNYALGGSRVQKKPIIVGAIKDGMKVYYRNTCPFSYPVEETFESEKAAAQKGYIPISCRNTT
ncbi:hypothetical protein FE782_28695 [Paenibacillus antri]|uniref:F0F1-type ATP synthase n=1 Tax=Paenibacillus antri TaxID=2582848 RepID=A0A5R9G5Q7_9BACL|nr:hypothetical protein [Paenibacillus antri]TLS48838.1 hypothetical protein FE782_28695 [Paenibacillus antri]